MGGCFSNNPDSAQDKSVGKDLKEDAKADKQIKKLLFLGAGGSGKSTLFKQLRNIHGTGFAADDRKGFIEHIHCQIQEQMRLVLEEMELAAEAKAKGDNGDDNKVPDDFDRFEGLNNPAAKEACHLLLSNKNDTKLNTQLAEACKTLWAEEAIKKIYEDRATTGIDDSSAHFWDKIDTVMESGYVPDETDILLVRFRTTGVIEQKFTIKKNQFHVFDVGGQKSERKKWINCFDNVTAVIFVASMSCYDEVMFEDNEKNSMTDQLELFEKTCNERAFVKTSMILFLNKKDLFEKKLHEGKEITLCQDFAKYDKDPISIDDTSAFIKATFVSKNADEKNIFAHLTCATDQNNVSKVFNDVQHIIIENSLMSAGLMGDLSDDDNAGGNGTLLNSQ